MNFKFATTAALAATMLFTFVGPDGSGARARAAETSQPLPTSEPALTDEVVPQFVEKEVVQPLPAPVGDAVPADRPDKPESLAAKIAATDVAAPLDAELECLAGAVYFESRGEPLSGQLAVAQVVVNRAASGRFPATYCGVVKQAGQFSFVKRGRIPSPATGSSAWRTAKAIARIAHEGGWDSPARDSLFFHATHVRPGWRMEKVATINSHVFYK